MNSRGQLGNGVLIFVVGMLLLGIIFIWINVNIAEPIQGIMKFASDKVADGFSTPRVEVLYKPDYTVLFLGPVLVGFLYLYMVNKQKQQEYQDDRSQNLIMSR